MEPITSETLSGFNLFVGGISVDVEASDLQEYFSQFGQVDHARTIINKRYNRSKGYGFVTMRCIEEAEKVLRTEHFLKGRKIDVQQSAILSNKPKSLDFKKNRLLVSGLPVETTDQQFESRFKEFGKIRICYVLHDQAFPKLSRLGCVEYKDSTDSLEVLELKKVLFQGKAVEIFPFSARKEVQEALTAQELNNLEETRGQSKSSNPILLSIGPNQKSLKNSILKASQNLNEHPSNYLFNLNKVIPRRIKPSNTAQVNQDSKYGRIRRAPKTLVSLEGSKKPSGLPSTHIQSLSEVLSPGGPSPFTQFWPQSEASAFVPQSTLSLSSPSGNRLHRAPPRREDL